MIDRVEQRSEDLSLEERYLALLVAAHYLGGAIRRLKNGRVSEPDLQVALAMSGNDVEEGEGANFFRNEATKLDVNRDRLEVAMERGFTEAFIFIHGPQITQEAK